ncbi:MAG: hypothetical protein LBB73_03875, partial [Dysgonamonadaceae bacterium]|nr:hypothetical protein [Dysgonamonadaceae bacterium]
MMKKTVFLFGLFLMIYGTVNVKAQIRIGGEALPDASAVLDLNLNDTAMATGGLLLPRVSLASNMDNTTFGYPLKRGLMVYNVNDDDFDRPKEGVYCYDGAKWVFAGEDNSVKFTMTSETKQVWLGRQGEFKKTLKATVISKPDVDPANVAYEWTVGDSVIQTLRPELSLNVGILSPDA